MSATALDLINRAGRRANAIEGEESFTAAEAVDNLQLLNDMLHGFPADGIYYTHSPLALSDTVNVPDEQLRNLVLMLSKEIALDYKLPVDQTMALEIERARSQLQAAYWIQRPGITDPLLRGRRGGRFNISTGE